MIALLRWIGGIVETSDRNQQSLPGNGDGRFRVYLRKARIVIAVVCCVGAATSAGALLHFIGRSDRTFNRPNWFALADYVGAEFADVATLVGKNAAKRRVEHILQKQEFVESFEYLDNGTAIRVHFDAGISAPMHYYIGLHVDTAWHSRAFWLMLFNPLWYGVVLACFRFRKLSRVILPAMCLLAILPTSMALASALGISGYVGILWAAIFSSIWIAKPSRNGVIGAMLGVHFAALILITVV